MLCALILYVSDETYSLTSTPNDRFLGNFFMAGLFTLRVFARNLLKGYRRRNTFRILFRCLAWGSNPGFSSNKPAHDHGPLINVTKIIPFFQKYVHVCDLIASLASNLFPPLHFSHIYLTLHYNSSTRITT